MGYRHLKLPWENRGEPVIRYVWAVFWPALLCLVFPGCEIAGEQVPDSPFPFAGSAFTLWGKYSLHSSVPPSPPQFEVVSMLQLKYISPNNIDSPSLVL